MRTTFSRRIAWIAALLLCTAVLSAAKGKKGDHERIYNAPFNTVWNACVQAANEKYTITYSEKASGALSFKQGMSWKTNSYGMNVGVTVVALSDTQTKVIINPQKKRSQLSWAGSDITKTFFKAVDNNLKSTVSPPAP
jgi:uncharacterized membrane-anchored protein